MADIQDFGEKIGGAKKDLWKIRGLVRNDVDNLNDRELEKYVTKDLVWKKPDYVKMLEEGYEPVALLYQKHLRDSLPAKLGNYRDLRTIAENYVTILNELQEFVSKIKTIEDLYNSSRQFLVDYGYIDDRTWTAKSKNNICLQDKKFTKMVQLSDREVIRLAQEAKLQNFPYEYRVKLKGCYIDTMGDKYYIFKEYSRITRVGLDSEEEVVTYCKEVLYKQLEEQDQKRKEKLQKEKKSLENGEDSAEYKLDRPQLKRIQRNGPNLRNNKHISGEDILKRYNFRGGEFGEWNSDSDRQAFLNYSYDALSDLAYVLNYPTQALGLGGYEGMKLAIAFGARGEGRALAHYEPSKVVINLTKLRGAGSLAHEWGHAFDDFLGHKCGKPGMLSKTASLYDDRIDNNIEKAMAVVMYYIKKKECTFEEEMEIAKNSLARTERVAQSWVDGLKKSFASGKYNRRTKETEYINVQVVDNFNILADKLVTGEVTVDFLSKEFKACKGVLPDKELRDKLSACQNSINYAKKSIEEATRDGKFKYGKTKNTNYLDCAIKIDGSKKSYWSSNVELFARAFESYVYDKLGFASDYLVHSVKGSGLYPEDMNPYPDGEERERINKAIQDLVDIVRYELFNKEELDSVNKAIYSGKDIDKSKEVEKPSYSAVTKQEPKKDINYNISDLKELRELLNDIIPKKIELAELRVYNRVKDKISNSMGVVNVGIIPENRKMGNSKAWTIANGDLMVDEKADKWKRTEGIIEAVVRVKVPKKYGKSEMSDMLCEGVIYMICKTVHFDVRTYCISDKFNSLLNNPKNCEAYVRHVVNSYKEIIPTVL